MVVVGRLSSIKLFSPACLHPSLSLLWRKRRGAFYPTLCFVRSRDPDSAFIEDEEGLEGRWQMIDESTTFCKIDSTSLVEDKNSAFWDPHLRSLSSTRVFLFFSDVFDCFLLSTVDLTVCDIPPFSHRHAPRCPRNLPGDTSPQAGHDVQRYVGEGDSGYVQEIHG